MSERVVGRVSEGAQLGNGVGDKGFSRRPRRSMRAPVVEGCGNFE